MRILPLTLAIVAVAACSKDDGKAAGENAAAEEVAVRAAAAESVTSGAITVERLQQGKASVEPGTKWEAAHATLQGIVGEPMFAVSKRYWYVAKGDQCHELAVEIVDGDVRSVRYSSGDSASLMDKCRKAAD